MKNEWIYEKLDDVCSVDYGTRVVQKKDKGSKYYVYGGGGATFMVDTYNREDCFVVARFAMSPKCTRFVSGKFFLNDSGLSVSTKSTKLLQSFVNKVLLANNDTIYNMGKGMAQKNLDMPSFRNLDIPVPPLQEQERIVAELDLLTEIIDKQKQQLKELDTLAQSIFYDMFGNPVDNDKGWALETIEKVCSSIVRGPFGSALKKEYFVEKNDSTYKVYEQKHAIQKNASIGSYYISEDKFQSLKRFEVHCGDIIMSCSGTIGELFEIPMGSEKGVMNQALLKFTLNRAINKLYFLHLMDFVKDSFEKKGTGLQNIGSVGTIKAMRIALPPIQIQESFAKKIQSIESQKKSINRSIAESQKLFDYTMDKYFG